MANPTLLTLARMAANAYRTLQSGAPLFQGDYQAQSWKFLGSFGEDGEGFVGCIFVADDESHTVVAYAGTDPTSAQDLMADLNIAVKRIPMQVENAKKIFEVAKQIQHGTLYIVGHSLGGALAQIVGTLKRVPFVTFNAPGMRQNLENQGLAFRDSWKGAEGVNYRMHNDWIGAFGKHLGEVRVLDPGGTVGNAHTAHLMATVVDYIEKFPELSNLSPLPLRIPPASVDSPLPLRMM